MSKVVPSKQNVDFQKSNKSILDKKSNKMEHGEKKSKWWVGPNAWRERSPDCAPQQEVGPFWQPERKQSATAELNHSQSGQMTAVMQLLAMPEPERTQLCSRANTLQQLLNSSQQNSTPTLPNPFVSNHNGDPEPTSANVSNVLTQLSQASAANNNAGDQRRLFAAESCAVHANDGAPKSIVENPDVP